MTRKIGVLYINGLGGGSTQTIDRLVRLWWRLAGLEVQHTHIHWHNGKSFDEKLSDVKRQAYAMLEKFDGIIIIGSSAGGSLALNIYGELKNKNVCVVTSRGRLKAGNYPENSHQSLYYSARLGSKKPLQSFYDSVMEAEHHAIPALTVQEKRRILTLTPLTDLAVPLECMSIDGVKKHRSLAFGHSGGFVAHLFADRDMIIKFARSVLR